MCHYNMSTCLGHGSSFLWIESIRCSKETHVVSP
uniref:Uncharacterized protein n=1 Tax=Arundo donax TaxID=35708 RepID=A0A0A9DJE1_ARUDO